MVKGAPVRIIRTEITQAALVTVQVVGEVAAVQAAVEVGAHAAKRVGHLVASHVIPRPAEEVRVAWVLDARPKPPPAASYAGMTVQELRSRARQVVGFPLRGRAIASATKGELVALLQKHA